MTTEKKGGSMKQVMKRLALGSLLFAGFTVLNRGLSLLRLPSDLAVIAGLAAVGAGAYTIVWSLWRITRTIWSSIERRSRDA